MRYERFRFPVVYEGQVLALLPSSYEAARFHEAIHGMGGNEELEVVKPPPPVKFLGESGIPLSHFEGNDASSPYFRVELKDPDQYAELLKNASVVSRDHIGGKVYLNMRKK